MTISGDERALAARAPGERVEANEGIVHRAAFMGRSGEAVFGVSTMPLDRSPTAGVVIASSLYTDKARLYRAEVSLARRLAIAGFAVQRFDYRSFGHSDGETGDTTIERMTEDLETARRNVEVSAGTSDVLFVGVRFGALLSAGTNMTFSRAVLWDPVLDGPSYFRHAFRAHMVGRLSRTGTDMTPQAQLTATGQANVLGFTVSRRLVESSERLALADAGAGSLAGADVLWVQSGQSSSNAEQRSIESLQSQVRSLSLSRVTADESGWFVGAKPLQASEAVDSVAGWMTEEEVPA
jgi:hypothetical protein